MFELPGPILIRGLRLALLRRLTRLQELLVCTSPCLSQRRLTLALVPLMCLSPCLSQRRLTRVLVILVPRRPCHLLRRLTLVLVLLVCLPRPHASFFRVCCWEVSMKRRLQLLEAMEADEDVLPWRFHTVLRSEEVL